MLCADDEFPYAHHWDLAQFLSAQQQHEQRGLQRTVLGTQEIPLRSISNADSRQVLAPPKYLSSGDTGQFADQINPAESYTISAPGIIRVHSLAAAAAASDDVISKGVPRILADADGGPWQSDVMKGVPRNLADSDRQSDGRPRQHSSGAPPAA